MNLKNDNEVKTYWENNIANFSGFYDKQSEETLIGSQFITILYRKFVFPIEKQYMLDRYNVVTNFINTNIREGMTSADIGCGCGIFVKQMVKNGAIVYASDYVAQSIHLTKQQLTTDEASRVHLAQDDILETPIHDVDVAISIGVLTYIKDIERYMNNILPHTKQKFIFNYLNSKNILNRIRKLLPSLNVRHLVYHDPKRVNLLLAKHDFRVVESTPLASGFVVSCERR